MKDEDVRDSHEDHRIGVNLSANNPDNLTRKRKVRPTRKSTRIKSVPIRVGMKIRKLFDDGNYYVGTVTAGPTLAVNPDTLMEESVWHVEYEDGDEEDMNSDQFSSDKCWRLPDDDADDDEAPAADDDRKQDGAQNEAEKPSAVI